MDEINDNWSADKGFSEEMYNKIISLLHANFSLIESIDKILLAYQDKVDENLKTDL